VDYIADQHSSNCCCQIQVSFYFFCNHFCWTDATSSACPWSLGVSEFHPVQRHWSLISIFCMAATSPSSSTGAWQDFYSAVQR
jgi:hypothetical protein